MGARLRRAFGQEIGLVVVVLLLGTLLTLFSEPVVVRGETVNNFLRLENLVPNVLTPMSWIAILALGATVVIVTAGIDISVGSVFGLSALACAAVLERLPAEAPAAVALPLGLLVPCAVGATCGALNGLLVVRLAIHPFVVTLGTLSIFRGVALVSVPEKTLPGLGRELPAAFTGFVGWRLPIGESGGFVQPVPVLFMLAALAVTHVLLRRTTFGRAVYAVGGNERAARFAGIRVGRTKLLVYTYAGLLAGLAGMVSCGFFQSANTATGEGYELTVIAASVVGGASLLGGRGTALGAMLGALVIALIENGIDVLGRVEIGPLAFTVSREYQKIIVGAAIVAAVAVDRLAHGRAARSA